MSDVIILVLFALGSYMFGNINWAIIISKSKKSDIRKMGSGNPGTLNMSRNLGLKFGLLTFFLDIMKGVLPTLIVYYVFPTHSIPAKEINLQCLIFFFLGRSVWRNLPSAIVTCVSSISPTMTK